MPSFPSEMPAGPMNTIPKTGDSTWKCAYSFSYTADLGLAMSVDPSSFMPLSTAIGTFFKKSSRLSTLTTFLGERKAKPSCEIKKKSLLREPEFFHT